MTKYEEELKRWKKEAEPAFNAAMKIYKCRCRVWKECRATAAAIPGLSPRIPTRWECPRLPAVRKPFGKLQWDDRATGAI